MSDRPADILLLACYELGHQPLSLAWPAAVLRRAGHHVAAVDLSVDPFPQAEAAQARFVGIAAPMHTALRLGVQAAERVRALNPQAHIAFYGLYAWLNADYLLAGPADSVLSGEVEAPLLALVDRPAAGRPDNGHRPPVLSVAPAADRPHLARSRLPVPDRSDLPPLSSYARYVNNGQAVPAGYVEASRGCLHTCLHCPVVPVYGGRFFVVPVETVLADVAQQVAQGARHVTFGDPDFLNGPGHALKVCRALHEAFPDLTFDFTTKVEHILQHRRLMPEFRALGAAFVVSAFESVDNRVLERLHKGHTRADLDEALAIMAEAGLPVQPTWIPFTPWTSLDNYLDLLTWIRTRGLIRHVPAVQLSIRLLVPPRSALLDEPETAGWLGPLDAANYTYVWRAADPCVDELQRRVAALAETAGDAYAAFAAIERLAYGLAGRPVPIWSSPPSPEPAPPRLTEDWFC